MVFSAQVTTAIIFNVEVFNEALRRVLTARRTAWSTTTVPVPEHTVKPHNQKRFFFLIQYIYHSHCTDDSAGFSLGGRRMESQWDPSAVEQIHGDGIDPIQKTDYKDLLGPFGSCIAPHTQATWRKMSNLRNNVRLTDKTH